jgi:ethanolamine utilization protein EutQ (cupin superfamily)
MSETTDTTSAIHISDPKMVEAEGNMPKQIAEHIGRLASGDTSLSIARMVSPSGWTETPQTPEFDEYTLVLRGELHVIAGGRAQIVRAGQAVRVRRGIRVQYATPAPGGADYVAICSPAFSPDTVHHD